MARTVNKELFEKKKAVMDEVFKFAMPYLKSGAEVPVDRFYETIPEAKKLWKTRAYFVQELKRKFLPDDINVISKQRRGTRLIFTPKPKYKLTIENPVTKKVRVLEGVEVSDVPQDVKKVSPSKWNRAIKALNPQEVYRVTNGYILKFEDKTILFA